MNFRAVVGQDGNLDELKFEVPTGADKRYANAITVQGPIAWVAFDHDPDRDEIEKALSVTMAEASLVPRHSFWDGSPSYFVTPVEAGTWFAVKNWMVIMPADYFTPPLT